MDAENVASDHTDTHSKTDLGATLRVLWLLILVTVVLMWLQQQLGFGIEKLGFMPVVLAFWAVLSKVAAKLEQKNIIEAVSGAITKFTRFVVQNALPSGPLAALSTLAFLLIATSSSVTVIGEGAASTVSLQPLAGARDTASMKVGSGTSDLARFRWVWTSPFGQLYRIEASGYSPATVTVYPFGRQVFLGRDLGPAPSVLFRPFVGAVGALRDGAIIRVTRVAANDSQVIATDTGVAAFRLGVAQPISDRVRDLWQLDLDAAKTPPAEQARLLMLWNKARQLRSDVALSQRDRLVVEVLLRNVVVAREDVTLAGDRLTDVLIQDVRQR